MEWQPTLVVLLFGLCIGSFLNVCIVRLPRNASVIRPRSHCPKCGTPIRWYDNIPLASYCWLGGRCRACRTPISWQYPIVELCTAGLAYLTYLRSPTATHALLYFLGLVAPLIVITFIDLAHRIIPDVISLSGIAVGFIIRAILAPAGAFGDEMFDAVIGMIVGGGLFWLIAFVYETLKHQEGLGGGDVKLAAMLGTFLGWKGLCFVLLASSLLGSIIGITMMAILRKGLKFAIPFGPFLAVGALLYLYWGEPILRWYFSLFVRM